MNHCVDELAARVAACEQENQRLRKLIRRQSQVLIGAFLAVVIGTATAGITLKNEVFGTIRANPAAP